MLAPLLGDVGCYVDDVDKNAFIFGEKDKVTLVSGDQAFTQAMVSGHRRRSGWCLYTLLPKEYLPLKPYTVEHLYSGHPEEVGHDHKTSRCIL